MTDIDEIIRKSLNFSSKVSEELNNKMIDEYSKSVKKGRRIPRWTVAVVIPAVIACISAGTYIAVESGFFKDKTTFTGTVTGQTYENATDEIEVKSEYSGGTLRITLNLLKYDTIPYSILDEIEPCSFSLVNLSDNSEEEIQFSPAKINGNTVEITTDFSAEPDTEYRLSFGSFLGSKKADQPLEIKGNWETVFET